MDALRRASFFRTSRCQGEQDCEACNRLNHIATFHAHLGGVACDATELYRENWMAKCVEVGASERLKYATTDV